MAIKPSYYAIPEVSSNEYAEIMYTFDDKDQVNHINGVRTDNRVENLEWVTNIENVHHALKNLPRKTRIFSEEEREKMSIRSRGENSKAAKMTDTLVIEMRKLYAQGVSQGDLKRKYNLNSGTVSRIVRNEAWKHIGGIT